MVEQDSTSQIKSGTVFEGRYRIERILGEGGMGEVYVATHTTLGRRVALKRLHAQYTSNKDVVARFIQEAKLAASIGHDNICEVIDVGTAEDGAPYLVMPILEGCTLSELISPDNQLPIDRIVDIICQTLSALLAAHDARIVHRDLKPDNIFITTYGDRRDFVKLLDFGISKILDQDSVSKLTQTGAVLGTPYYMAPEQARGAKDIDHRIDIYAMGVILYEALTGKKPYNGQSYNEVMFKIIAEPFDAPRVLNPSIPGPMEQIVLKAMSKDPQDRFANANDMRNALKQVVEDMSTRVSTPPALTSSGTQMEHANAFTPTGISTAIPIVRSKDPVMVQTNGPSILKKNKWIVPVIAATLVVIVISIGIFIKLSGNETEIVTVPIPNIEVVTPATVENPAPTEPDMLPGLTLQPELAADPVPAETADKTEKTSRTRRKPKPHKSNSKPRAPKPTKSVIITEKPETPPGVKPKDDDKSLDGRFGTKFAPVYND